MVVLVGISGGMRFAIENRLAEHKRLEESVPELLLRVEGLKKLTAWAVRQICRRSDPASKLEPPGVPPGSVPTTRFRPRSLVMT